MGRLSKPELIFCGVLLLAALGFVVYRIDYALYKEKEPEILDEACRYFAVNETMPLALREIGREHNLIPWDGTVEMTIDKVVLYESYDDAERAEEEVTDPNGLLHDRKAPFLVVKVNVRNVDAEEGHYSWTDLSFSKSDDAVTLVNYFDLLFPADGTSFANSAKLPSVIWNVDGVASSDFAATADVPQGESVNLTLGYSLENDLDSQLDRATVIYSSPYERMSIGTPELGSGR